MTVTNKKNVNIVIADEDLRNSVQNAIDSQYKANFFVDVASCISAEGKDDIALILCDKNLLNSDQAELLSQLKTTYPSTRYLIIGPHCTSELQIAVLKQGARGYFDCSSSLANLSNAFHCVLMGEVWVERHVIAGLIDELSQPPKISEEQQKTIESLSPKEREVAELVSHGATNKKIAYEMEITERTVKSHLTTIFHKMDISDRLSLAIFFRDLR
jgi:DNA-binding NarL/FixJ family response regulator